jgi:chromate transport protein ChrA
MTRYKDAYLVARVTAGFGNIIKGVGIALAVLVLIGALVASDNAYGDMKTVYVVAGSISAVIIGVVFFLFGILVSAQGQILKASLDSAVNNSPFLTNDQKAQTMSLR